MDSENAAAREAMGEAVRAVVERKGGVRAVARLLGKETTFASQVSRWQRGQDVTLAAMSLLARATGETIEFSFGPDGSVSVDAKEPPPNWAGAMESRIVSEVVASREALYASLAQDLVNAQLGRTPPPDAPPTGRRGRPPGGEGPKPKPTG